MKNKITVYHGSKYIINEPYYGGGKPNNDYGIGFYCTKDIELAKEWSVSATENGYANIYELDLTGLNILNLNDYSVLNWITILIENRIFTLKSDVAEMGVEFLKNNFKIDLSKYDVVIGYRADDSYFTFAKNFLDNNISVRRLKEVLQYGDLGQQIVLVSEKAFKNITYLGNVEVDFKLYYPLREERNKNASEMYLKNKRGVLSKDDIYLIELLRGDVDKNDPRLS